MLRKGRRNMVKLQERVRKCDGLERIESREDIYMNLIAFLILA